MSDYEPEHDPLCWVVDCLPADCPGCAAVAAARLEGRKMAVEENLPIWEAAVAAAEQRGKSSLYPSYELAHQAGIDVGVRRGLKAAREAVISLRSGSWGTDYDGVQIDMADALAAIDGITP